MADQKDALNVGKRVICQGVVQVAVDRQEVYDSLLMCYWPKQLCWYV